MSNQNLSKLPSDIDDVSGPINTSNWVIPGKLIAGSYPGSLNEKLHLEKVRNIIQTGVTRFVCLMEDEEREGLVSYEADAQTIASEYGRQLDFEYFPMPDMQVPKDEDLVQFIPQLADKIKQSSEVVYVHCWGGHGRTGIVIALLLTVLYDHVDEEEALRLTELYHSKRVEARLHSPQTTVQFEQVRRVAKVLKSLKKEPLPVLPPLPADTDDLRGPIAVSNWVIPGRLIAGGYPGNIEHKKHLETICSVFETGVARFVCLMQDRELERFVPYIDIVKQLAKDSGRRVEFDHLPMPDGFIPKDEDLVQFIPQLADKIKQSSEVVYVHCWGGHGRTGIVIALLLTVLYDHVDEEESLRLTELYHSKRVETRDCHSPQTKTQKDQVRRVAKLLNLNKRT